MQAMNVMEISKPAAARFDVEVDGQTPASWSGILAGFDDASIYQTWAYGAVRWGARNLSHMVLRDGGKPVAAAQVRIVRMPFLRTGIAYVRWGPLCRKGQPDAAALEKMLECLRNEYCKRRGLILQIIPNVYPGDPQAALYQPSAGGFRVYEEQQPYRTVLVDLSPEPELIRKRLDQKWRNQLNASERKGLEFETTCGADGYREFEKLYQVMKAAKQFDSTVDVGEFGRIQQELEESEKMRIFIARKDGEAVGALVCSLAGDTAIYLLGATNGQARELKASYFLHWRAMMWLKEHGARVYDLGGVDPEENPGGYHFKSGFGGSDRKQIPAVWASGGILGDALHQGINWVRRRRAKS